MSRITNNNPPQRGQKLTSTDLNQVFTDVNNAFPMDGDNVRNEGIDQPAFNLAGTSGKSGIILIAADDDETSTPTVVNANTASVPPFDVPVAIQTWSTGIVPFNEDKIIRVYWQFENEIFGSAAQPITADTNATAWAVWLEWQLSSGGAWNPVPFQSDFEDILVSPAIYGASTLNTYGCTIVNHVYIHQKSGTTEYDFPPDRTKYGSWWFQADQDYTIYGLRLMCRGLIQNFYNSTPVNPPASNAWKLVLSPVSTHQIIVNASQMAYMIMEEQ
jgi:hypothetical protein